MSNLRRHMQTCKAAKRYESQGIQYYRASTALTTETTEDVRNRKLGLVYPRNDAQDLQPGASPWGCSPSFPSPERFALQDELTPMPYLPSSRNLSEPSSRQDPWSSYDSSETLQRSVEVGCAPDSVAPYGHHPGNHTTIRREEQSEIQRIPSMLPTTQGPPTYSHRGYALTGGSHNNPEVAYEGPLPPSSSFPNLAAHRPSYPYERTDAPGSRH
ncbi:hypothetical protein FRC02_008515 [Tulasnella sp. 418]|nr:hypothetical protein FRC02_008515 [Tulasnella sp. 418]